MIPVVILTAPLVGGVLAWVLGARRPVVARWVTLVALTAAGAATLPLLPRLTAPSREWLAEWSVPWIESLGIRIALGLDALSVGLVLLTVLLGIAAVLASWTEVDERVGFFHFNLAWCLAGVLGVFMAVDLVFFYLCWELMLVPMYLLVAIWGHERRRYAALKLFLFTRAGGLAMLVAILAVAVDRADALGKLSFDLRALASVGERGLSPWLMLGFFVAFAVKLPAFGLHTWLPDAHTQAPTAGSVVLAGLLLKTGGYGLLRVCLPLFPATSAAFAPAAMLLGAAGVLYGALLAFAQTDLKRLIAYTSVSHLGFVLIGIYAGGPWGYRGAVMQMICHGLSTGGLFIVAGAIQERLHTRELAELGGSWRDMPRLGTLGMVLVFASIGLPGLGNFVAELLVLAAAYQRFLPAAVLAALGLIGAAIYGLWMIQRVLHGGGEARTHDATPREWLLVGVLVAALLALGLFPQPVLDTVAAPPLPGGWR